jgi:hypothetical protein
MTVVKSISNGVAARLIKAKHREIAIRYRNSRNGTKPVVSMAALRIAELEREFSDRYGHMLPDDDAGREDVTIMLNHIARRLDAAARMAAWLDSRAPWFIGHEREQLCTMVLANPLRYRADTLGKKLGLTAERRARLGIRTIGAVNQTAAERTAASEARKLEAKRNRRRAKGMKPRDEYLANSVEGTKPWEAEGISRRTWYRRKGQER